MLPLVKPAIMMKAKKIMWEIVIIRFSMELSLVLHFLKKRKKEKLLSINLIIIIKRKEKYAHKFIIQS